MPKNIDISKVKEALQHKANPYPLELWFKSFAAGNVQLEEDSFYGYIPIRLVALIEDSVRDEYALIIDDKRFRKNLTDVIDRNIPLNVEVLSSLQDDVISIGEYFSYSLSCNGIEDIIKNLSKLLGSNFRDELLKKLGDESRSIFGTVNKVFNERHLLCHESSLELDYDKNTVISYVHAVIHFIDAIREIVQNKINPNTPDTTVEMINATVAEYEALEKELAELIQTINDNDNEGTVVELGCLDFIEIWKKYREDRAEIDSKSFEGGSMQPIVYYDSKVLTTRWLIKELRSTYKYLLRSVNK